MEEIKIGQVMPLRDVTTYGTLNGTYVESNSFGLNPALAKLRQHSAEDKSSFENGATSSKIDDWHLHIPEAEEALVKRLTLGARKHSPTNWKKGGKEFLKARYGHLRKHISHLLASGGAVDDDVDDDLGAILCNAAFLCWYRKNKPQAYRAAFQELNGTYPDIPVEPEL